MGVPALDKVSPVPLYHQLAMDLRARLESGEFGQGEAIPTEPELEKAYGVSRVTVRRAVQELVRENLLETQQGRGTFVSAPKAIQELNAISSWAETMRSLGKNPVTRSLRIAKVPAPPQVAELLRIPPGSTVTRLERLRCADGEPVCLMTNYLRSELVPGLTESGLDGESLYETLENRYRIRLAWARETVGARAASAAEAEALTVHRGFPLLAIRRVSYGFDERPVEVVLAVNRADRYEYSVALRGLGRPQSGG